MTDWNKLKVVDLKAELKKRGLPQTGLKPALVARLTAAETEDGSESEATVQGDVAKQDANSVTSPDTISPIQSSSDQKIDISSNAPLPQSPEPKTELPAAAPAPSPIPQDLPTVEAQTENTPAPSAAVAESSVQTNGLPLARPEEALEDGNKRKRRSQSPPPTDTDIPRKRARQDEVQDSADISTSSKGPAEAEAQNATVDRELEAGAREDAPPADIAEQAPEVNDAAMEDAPVEPSTRRESGADQVSGKHMEVDEKPKDENAVHQEGSPSRPRNSKYKDLFSAQNQAPLEKPAPRDSAPDAEETEQDRIISPAIHPATAALYIRDFMRPLNPGQLKNHLATLAAPPGRDPDSDVIVNFYLDPIRTHAFIHFSSVSAASRVRSVLHDRIWPEERTRKPLWADFIPVDKVEEWIQIENEGSGGRAMAKKWEVYYDVDEDRNVTTELQESGAAPHGEPARKPSNAAQPPLPPTQPRGIEGAPSGPRSTQIRGQITAMNLSRLDELFNCTATKPALYWKPVDKTLANKRLDNIDHATSKDYVSNRTGGDINRYIFEDGDVVVDRGPEIFPGIRPPVRDGPRGGGPRGGRGYQGRGGYSRGSDRYDSYRGDVRDSRDSRRY